MRCVLSRGPRFDREGVDRLVLDPSAQGRVNQLVPLDGRLPLESGRNDARLEVIVGAGQIDDLYVRSWEHLAQSLGHPLTSRKHTMAKDTRVESRDRGLNSWTSRGLGGILFFFPSSLSVP